MLEAREASVASLLARRRRPCEGYDDREGDVSSSAASWPVIRHHDRLPSRVGGDAAGRPCPERAHRHRQPHDRHRDAVAANGGALRAGCERGRGGRPELRIMKPTVPRLGWSLRTPCPRAAVAQGASLPAETSQRPEGGGYAWETTWRGPNGARAPFHDGGGHRRCERSNARPARPSLGNEPVPGLHRRRGRLAVRHGLLEQRGRTLDRRQPDQHEQRGRHLPAGPLVERRRAWARGRRELQRGI